MSFRATVLTLFPEMFPGPLGLSLSGQALRSGIWSLKAVDIRGFARDKHRSVDDTPAGGGAGMVMRADVLAPAVDSVLAASPDCPLIYLTPRGVPLTQARLRSLSAGPGVTVVCGRFEGIDERVFETRPGLELSVGDYVLSGGEIAALVVLDGIVRLLPGVMGAESSLDEESFDDGLLEYPHYTRPRTFEGKDIPPVLLSGDHAAIRAWRKREAERVTKARRPDLAGRGKDKGES